MLSFKGFLSMLLEDRIEFLKKQHTEPTSISTAHDPHAEHKDPSAIIDHFASKADPSKNKQFTQWIVDKYKKGQIRQEDHPRIKEALQNFSDHQRKLPKKDINQYKSLSDVEDAVEPHLGTAKSGKEEKRLVKSEGADLIHETPDVTVHKLKTKEAACQYGSGTRWCTAAKNNNMFDQYHKQGPLYVVQGKNDGRKYQFHFESDQFMDEKDSPVNVHQVAKKYGLDKVPEFEHKHVAFMKPENLKNHEYLLAHQDAIVRTGQPEHLSALLDADLEAEKKEKENLTNKNFSGAKNKLRNAGYTDVEPE